MWGSSKRQRWGFPGFFPVLGLLFPVPFHIGAYLRGGYLCDITDTFLALCPACSMAFPSNSFPNLLALGEGILG